MAVFEKSLPGRYDIISIRFQYLHGTGLPHLHQAPTCLLRHPGWRTPFKLVAMPAVIVLGVDRAPGLLAVSPRLPTAHIVGFAAGFLISFAWHSPDPTTLSCVFQPALVPMGHFKSCRLRRHAGWSDGGVGSISDPPLFLQMSQKISALSQGDPCCWIRKPPLIRVIHVARSGGHY
jgi:hypothetical protein